MCGADTEYHLYLLTIAIERRGGEDVVQMNNPGPDRDGRWSCVWAYDCVAGYIFFLSVCFHSVYINEILPIFLFVFMSEKSLVTLLYEPEELKGPE